ncbi:MAG TPA: SDR family NAD(P)-dependent oxidoreductase [Xanthobacteraceae bacterium]
MAKANGKTALVTGSTDGVGREVARRLGGDGWRVLVHGRDRGRGQEVVAAIEQAGGTAELIIADLSVLAEVRSLADAVKKATPRLDLLLNNAGIGSGGPQGVRQESADGCELRFAVNYPSGFLLTHLLLPLIKKSAPARIVNVSSLGQQAIDFGDVMLTRDYSGMRAYRQSKLAQILFTLDLAHDLAGSGVSVTTLHPATFMNTAMVRQFGTPMSTVEEGADAIMRLAVSPELEGKTGLYFNGQTEAKADAQAYDAPARQKLQALSVELAGLRKAATAG